MKILIIEDDLELREELKVLLDNNGYQGIILKDFKNALEEILVIDPDLILLDIKIPFLNGQQLLKKLREKSTIPVIMVTSKDSEIDEILALSYGADDYICKPFDIHELLARIKVQLRQYEPKQRQLIYKDWTIDLDLMTLNAAGQSIDLTSLEFKIIELFMRYPQKVFTKENIYEYVWEDDYVVGDKTIHVHISNIRTKLKSTGTDHYIQTVWGMGFKLID